MQSIANVVLPERMSPLLALALGRTFVAHNHPLGDNNEFDLSTFTAMALLHQSWKYSQPRRLSDYLQDLRDSIFSEETISPLVALAAADPYMSCAIEGKVSISEAMIAKNAVLHFASRLAKTDAARLSGPTCLTLVRALERSIKTSPTLVEEIRQTLESVYPEAIPGGFVDSRERAVSASGSARFDEFRSPFRLLQDAASGRQPSPSSPPSMHVPPYSQPSRFGANGNRRIEPQQKAADPAVAQPTEPAAAPEEMGFRVKVFDQLTVVDRLHKMGKAAANEGNSQQRRLLELMAEQDGMREVTQVLSADPLKGMFERYPHFTQVLSFIQMHLALAACGGEGRPARIPPILLRGPAGTGKTSFAQELARLLQAHFVERDLSVTSDAWVISGMDSGWKGSKPGVVFDALVNGKTANPVILLNEVDKVSTGGSHNSPISAMYSLLEPTSSSRFVDEFVPVEIDASRVIWILTANDGAIPDPVLSRLEVFDIAYPDFDQCKLVAASVWKSICDRDMPKGHGFNSTLEGKTLDSVARISTRTMRKMLTLAASRAALQGRHELGQEDLLFAREHYDKESVKDRKPFGFMAE